MSAVQKIRIAEFICPDCGRVNRMEAQLLEQKYKEHAVMCKTCHHELEVVIADGLGNNLNIIASSKDEPR